MVAPFYALLRAPTLITGLLAGLLVWQPLLAQATVGSCPLCDEASGLVDRFGLRESADPVRERSNWSVPRKVVTEFGTPFAEQLSLIAPNAEVIGVNSLQDVPALIAGADVYIGRCTPEIIAAGQDLKYIHIPRAGADTCAEIPEVAERGILVTNMQRVLSAQIADHAMALVLSLSRNMAAFGVDQAQGSFDMSRRGQSPVFLLEGKTMLVVGLGGIGTEVAKRADAFGMRVTATRNSSREGPDFVDYVGLADEVLELAAEADVVVNATPLTPATDGMFDAEFFEAMKPTAWFINVGRGQSVRTADLVAALESGAIAGAGLDVYDPEPLPPGHALWDMPNVVLTPHVAGVSDRGRMFYGGLAAINFRRYAAGEPVLNVVNLRRGY
jgi:phosphoglycerate dehydrogenase-like enzyme